MSIAGVIEQAAAQAAPVPRAATAPDIPEYRALVSVLFAVHRRVAVRMADGTEGPVYCTCGDVWPCRSEELAAGLLDFPFQAFGPGRTY